MNRNRIAQDVVGTLTMLGVVILVSIGLVFSFPGNVGFAADQKPPKKSTKSSGKGLEDLKAPDVTASEGDTATAIRGKPGHSADERQRGDGKASEGNEEGTEADAPTDKASGK
jgi:hypothetical protein